MLRLGLRLLLHCSRKKKSCFFSKFLKIILDKVYKFEKVVFILFHSIYIFNDLKNTLKYELKRNDRH